MPNELTPTDAITALVGFLERHAKVLLLTGAGISTASGIPDYRDQDGVRRGRTPVQGPEFRRSAAVRRRYWARSMIGWRTLAQAEPNAGHRAMAELEERGWIASLVTQNVDGLHQRAGSLKVVELHGTIHAVVCLDCDALFSRAFVQELLDEANPGWGITTPAMAAPDGDAHVEPDELSDFQVPHCPNCAGTLKPDVVFFGDNIPRARTEAVHRELEQADALLVAGSSLMVYSGFRLCKIAAESGKPIAAINLGKTRADHLLSLKVEQPSEQILPMLAGLLGHPRIIPRVKPATPLL